MTTNRKKITGYVLQITAFIIILIAISLWQGRNMLKNNLPVPKFNLYTLNGNLINTEKLKSRKAILYFFSPWCSVCKISSHNINAVRESQKQSDTEIYAIALSYSSKNEVQKFAEKHKLQIPVLLGNNEISEKFKISSFPSIYIINSKGKIEHKVIGYATEFGIRTRLFFTD